ncbi:uncharacterized protein KD926_009655 [Aspergillus affinis]|uniref:uncharacterized protein n=1 Tax=Aspergillus affinis TaxID=1070780 RepID=UPI0022FEE69E|nr:uncharacterized protein KD926_009655 [Aspergillus affinis]KAI9045241.1 hypothetical protein KD926_009655 [Aspergillus affinis]
MAQPTPEQLDYYMAHADDDKRPNEIASLVCGLLAAIVAVAARFTARRISRITLGPEDWTIIAAMMGEITYAVVFAKAIDNGQGRHIIFVKDAVSFSKGYVAAIVSYSFTVMVTKISVLLFYCRLFGSKWIYTSSWIVGTIVVLYNLAVILIAGLQCIPLSDLWTGGSSCINTEPPFTGLAVVNIVTDVLILALPVKPVMNLNMKSARKVQVLGIFLLGGVVCVFGIIRAVAMTELSLFDPTWTAVGAAMWSFVEISVGIVAACLPMLGPLVRGKSGTSANPSGGSGYVRSGKFSATVSSKSGYIQQDDIPLTDDWRQNAEGSSSNQGRTYQVQGGPPVSPSPSKHNAKQISVQHDIQSTTTFV